jgi:hypothetical protein
MIMKMKRKLVPLLLFGLCGTTPAFAHYNPSTGRWLSRDPLVEAAFFSNFSRKDSQFSDQDFYFASSAYGFVRNDPISLLDYKGLLEGASGTHTIADCNIEIYAAHGFTDNSFNDDGTLRNPNAVNRLPFPHHLKGSTKCSGGAIIACNTAKFASIENPIPGVNMDDGEITVAEGSKKITSAVDSAKSFAESICKNCACEKVTIKVHCWNPFSKPGTFTPGNPLCGETITVPCKKLTCGPPSTLEVAGL